MLPAIERVDGVASAVPVVQSVTVAEDGAGRRMLIAALGVDCSIEKGAAAAQACGEHAAG